MCFNRCLSLKTFFYFHYTMIKDAVLTINAARNKALLNFSIL